MDGGSEADVSSALLGEHFETHLFVSAINSGKKIEGYKKGLLEVHNLRRRHRELVKEMLRRGYNHRSPLDDFQWDHAGWVNRKKSLEELARRCKACRKLQKEKRKKWKQR